MIYYGNRDSKHKSIQLFGGLECVYHNMLYLNDYNVLAWTFLSSG